MITLFSRCFIKFCKWLSNQEELTEDVRQQIKNNYNYAVLSLQEDDRNHLYIKVENESIYERVSMEELRELLTGSFSFVEKGCYDASAKEIYKRIAELLPKVEKWIITVYPEYNGVIAKAIEIGEKNNKDYIKLVLDSGKEIIFK